jgi:hypothetical protein
MRRPSFWLAILLGGASPLASVCFAQVSENVAQVPQPVFAVSLTPGSRDEAGRFMGGREMRVLAAHAGRVYAGTGIGRINPGRKGLRAHRSSFSTDRVRDGGSITTSTSTRRMGGGAIWPSQLSKISPS